MKTPKTFIAILLLANVFALTAQESKTISTDKTVVQKLDLVTIERKAVEMTDNFLPGVTLTVEQKQTLQPRFATFLEQQQTVTFSKKSLKESIAEKQVINKTLQASLDSVLTSEQKQAQREYLKQRRQELDKKSQPQNRPY